MDTKMLKWFHAASMERRRETALLGPTNKRHIYMEQVDNDIEQEEAKISIAGSINVSSTADAVFTAQNFSLAIEDTLVLADANLVLLRGHRYGLVGENGAGKTTLMQAILSRLEMDDDTSLIVAYVGQNDAELSAATGCTVLEHCLDGDVRIRRLKDEMANLEDDDEEDVSRVAERIGEIMDQLEEYKRTEPEKRAFQTLRSLGFTRTSCNGAVDELSGGWRTRLEIARALFAQPNVLMLDEPTNHLDLHAVLHLASMLRHNNLKNTTTIVVSHDASFLDLVCTDIIALHSQHMQCFSGNYAAFEEKADEYRIRHERLYKNRVAEEAKQKESIAQAKTRARKATNDKALKQAASRERKAESRVGLYREDGKRFKFNSLKVLDPKAVRLPARAEPVRMGKAVTLRLPPSTAAVTSTPLVMVDDLNFGYEAVPPVLRRITCSISSGDRIALVGKNGSGKSTLIRALMGEEDVKVSSNSGGQRGVQRRGRVALLDQNQLALLADHLDQSSVEFLANRYPYSSKSRFGNEGDIRQHLGGFGLAGDIALLPISELSGGLRVRLCLAELFADVIVPDVLLLDEPTNHLDAETTHALSNALKTYQGAVLVVSHNFGFLMSVCRDLWLCENGSLQIRRHSDSKDFAHHFRQFAGQIVSKDDRADLDLVLTVRATRNTLVIQGNAQQTSLLV